jgi:hypothetical protein
MKKNMGNLDRLFRLVLAAAISALYLNDMISGTLGIVLMAFSAIFLLTSLVSFCPLYTLFGISTCPRKG